MPNRYTQVGFNQPISQFVPLPFNEAQHAAAGYQHDYDVGQHLPEELKGLYASVKEAPWHTDLKQNLIQDFSTKANNLIDQYHGDFADHGFQQKMQGLKNDFINDPKLQTIQRDHDWFTKQYLPYATDPKNSQDIDLTLPKSQISHSIAGRLNTTQYADPLKSMDEVYKGINVDGYSLSQIAKTGQQYGDSIHFIDTDGHTKEISANKVRSITQGNIGNYINSPGGLWHFRKLAQDMLGDNIDVNQLTANNYKQVLGNELGNHIENQLGQDMFNYGSKYIMKDTDLKYHRTNDEVGNEQRKKQIVDIQPGYQGVAPTISNKAYDISEFQRGTNPFVKRILSGEAQTGQAFDTKGYNLKAALSNEEINNAIYKEFGQGAIDLIRKGGADTTLSKKVIDYLKTKDIADLGFQQPKELSEQNQKLFNNVVDNFFPEHKKTIDQALATGKKVPNELLDKIYSASQKVAEKAVQDFKSNTIITGFSGQENEIFKHATGKNITEDMKLKDLASGLIGANTKVYDIESGKELNFSDFAAENADAEAKVSGKLDPRNMLTTLTGNQGYSNGMQVVVEGKPYFITGPDFYKSGDPVTEVKMNNQLQANKTINKLYQLEATPEHIAKWNFDGKEVKVNYDALDGTYKLKSDLGELKAQDPQDLMILWRNALSKSK